MSIDYFLIEFKNVTELFKERDVIGLGLIHFPEKLLKQCFATLNGKLIGKILKK